MQKSKKQQIYAEQSILYVKNEELPPQILTIILFIFKFLKFMIKYLTLQGC